MQMCHLTYTCKEQCSVGKSIILQLNDNDRKHILHNKLWWHMFSQIHFQRLKLIVFITQCIKCVYICNQGVLKYSTYPICLDLVSSDISEANLETKAKHLRQMKLKGTFTWVEFDFVEKMRKDQHCHHCEQIKRLLEKSSFANFFNQMENSRR